MAVKCLSCMGRACNPKSSSCRAVNGRTCKWALTLGVCRTCVIARSLRQSNPGFYSSWRHGDCRAPLHSARNDRRVSAYCTVIHKILRISKASSFIGLCTSIGLYREAEAENDCFSRQWGGQLTCPCVPFFTACFAKPGIYLYIRISCLFSSLYR